MGDWRAGVSQGCRRHTERRRRRHLIHSARPRADHHARSAHHDAVSSFDAKRQSSFLLAPLAAYRTRRAYRVRPNISRPKDISLFGDMFALQTLLIFKPTKNPLPSQRKKVRRKERDVSRLSDHFPFMHKGLRSNRGSPGIPTLTVIAVATDFHRTSPLSRLRGRRPLYSILNKKSPHAEFAPQKDVLCVSLQL